MIKLFVAFVVLMGMVACNNSTKENVDSSVDTTMVDTTSVDTTSVDTVAVDTVAVNR